MRVVQRSERRVRPTLYYRRVGVRWLAPGGEADKALAGESGSSQARQQSDSRIDVASR